MMNTAYKVQCFWRAWCEHKPFNVSPSINSANSAATQSASLNKVDLYHTISQLGLVVPYVFNHVSTSRCVCVVHVWMCLSASHPGSLTSLFFASFPHCIHVNASVACLPTRTDADLFFYKTFQLKIVAPPINLAPFVDMLLFGSDPSWKDEEWFLCVLLRGRLWVIYPSISVIHFYNGGCLYI